MELHFEHRIYRYSSSYILLACQEESLMSSLSNWTWERRLREVSTAFAYNSFYLGVFLHYFASVIISHHRTRYNSAFLTHFVEIYCKSDILLQASFLCNYLDESEEIWIICQNRGNCILKVGSDFEQGVFF